MKKYLLFLLINCYFSINAQNKLHPFSVSFKVGPIFSSYESNSWLSTNLETKNRWNIELGVEENKFGFGINARYITQRGFIRNPLPQKKPIQIVNDRFNLQLGDRLGHLQYISKFSFFINKRAFVLNKKNKVDFAVGTQMRQGWTIYFNHNFGWETWTDDIPIDKYGLLLRLGYTYMISKHFSITTNIEYSRFKMKPADFWDFNVLAGVRF